MRFFLNILWRFKIYSIPIQSTSGFRSNIVRNDACCTTAKRWRKPYNGTTSTLLHLGKATQNAVIRQPQAQS